MLLGGRQRLREAEHEREFLVDRQPLLRRERRVAKRLSPGRDPLLEVSGLELAPENQDVRSRRRVGLPGLEFHHEPSRPLDVTRRQVRVRGSERSAVSVGDCLRRRAAKRVLAEVCRQRGRSAQPGDRRSLLEHGCGPHVRLVRRQREMASAVERIVDDEGEQLVDAPTLGRAERLIGDRGEERMREAETAVDVDDDASRPCGLERAFRDAGAS